jgi:hypothetical protein
VFVGTGSGKCTAAGVPDIEALHARLMIVERRATWVTRAAGAAGVLVLLAATLAGAIVYRERSLASTSERLEGQQIELRDGAGKVRALLGVRADGSVALIMSDAHAIPRMMLGLGPDGVPALGLSDSEGRLRAAIAVAADGAASVGFLDGSQMVRSTLGTTGNGAPALNLVDDARRVRVALQADTDGTSLLRLFDRAGQPRVALGLNDDTPSLTMRDEDGALLGRMPGR